MLYLVATPIGNLEDITYRAIKTLTACDFVLCEDTRKSRILLSHYRIKKRLISFHKYNEKSKEAQIIKDLKKGKKIALISDGGTPLICDPGYSLVQSCLEKNIPFTYIPGPCSLISALLLSGFFPSYFQFLGFLSKKPKNLEKQLKKMLYYPGTSIAFDTPHRIIKTLTIIERLDPKRTIALSREITKKFEESLRGTARELLEHFSKTPPKGELILVVEGGKIENNLSLEELVEHLRETFQVDLKEAISLAAKFKNIPKRDIYKTVR